MYHAHPDCFVHRRNVAAVGANCGHGRRPLAPVVCFNNSRMEHMAVLAAASCGDSGPDHVSIFGGARRWVTLITQLI